MRVKIKLEGFQKIELLEREKDNQSSKDGKYKYFLSSKLATKTLWSSLPYIIVMLYFVRYYNSIIVSL